MQTLACQLSSTLMHLLFLFDWDKRVEKILMQTLACQLSLVNSHQLLSCNSCSCLTRTRELRKLSCKLSLVNSHQLLSCISCSCLTGTRELRKLSCKLSLVNSHQLMQLLFLFNWDTRIEKILMQTLACQLSSTLNCIYSKLIFQEVQFIGGLDRHGISRINIFQFSVCNNARNALNYECKLRD